VSLIISIEEEREKKIGAFLYEDIAVRDVFLKS
jgi:hypothetical protein